MKRSLLAVCLAATMIAGACGDDDDNGGVTNPGTGTDTGTGSGGSGTTSCTQTTVSQRAEADLGRGAWEPLSFTTSTEGRLDVTVSWRSPEANVGAFLVNAGSCSETQFRANQCSFLLASGDDNPHRMSARFPAGGYELLVQNFGGTSAPSEPVSATVVLSAGADCPAFPSPSPSATPAS
jgi:hypothetical protein